MPIRVELPEKLRGRHFIEASEDEPNEIGVKRISVQLMHQKNQNAAPDTEIEAHFAKDSGTDEDNDEVDEEEAGSSDPTSTVRWGLGDGTTSGGGFTPAGDDFTIQGQGRQEKKRELTVFVNLKKLMKKKLSGAIAETNENKEIHLFNGNKEVPIPRFQVTVKLSAEDLMTTSFSSLVSDNGRPKLLADQQIGPVLEPGEKTHPNIKFNVNSDYFGFPEKGNQFDAQKVQMAHVASDTVNLNEELPKQKTNIRYISADDMKINGFDNVIKEEFDIARALAARTKQDLVEIEEETGDVFYDNDITLGINLSDKINTAIGNDEEVNVAAKVRRQAYTYFSYEKNTDIETMNSMDIESEEKKYRMTFSGSKLGGSIAMGKYVGSGQTGIGDVINNLIAVVSSTTISAFLPPVGLVLAGKDAAVAMMQAISAAQSNFFVEARAERKMLYMRPGQQRKSLYEKSEVWTGDADIGESKTSEKGDITFDQYAVNPVLLLNRPESRRFAKFADEYFSSGLHPVGTKIELAFKYIVLASMENNFERQAIVAIHSNWESDGKSEGGPVLLPGSLIDIEASKNE
jgi:BMFP domain-containing protein YqiC